ncbi:hypothetical protein ANCDUO_05282 [Ancylostoma duodenale]|uniref:Uncharacterized protein n=1 Tax=Ancylostoma duodenale TaxID=51022 RepID=A0A0C2DP19_9BILA|nr:hypothetical protein ANCDUO_05282 [Ancylostoma duodenale]
MFLRPVLNSLWTSRQYVGGADRYGQRSFLNMLRSPPYWKGFGGKVNRRPLTLGDSGESLREERPPGERPPGERSPGERPPGERPPGERPPGDCC